MNETMVPLLTFLVTASSLAPGNADCLVGYYPDAIPASERRNITMEGVSMPLGLVSRTGDSGRAWREVGHIVYGELMGYNTGSTEDWSNREIAHRLAGCRNPKSWVLEDADCAPLAGNAWAEHVSLGLELWDTAGIQDLIEKHPQSAPVKAREMSYKSYEGMFVFQSSTLPAKNDSISLTYYTSWNASWGDVSPYFSKLNEFNRDDLLACSANWRLGEAVLIANFLKGTGAQDAVATGKFTCYDDRWVLGPGCRTPGFNPIDCVPFLTYSGWLLDASLQRIFAYNIAVAVAETVSFDLYVSLPRQFRTVAYWWFPAKEFQDMGAQPIVWPPSNTVAWDSGIRTGSPPHMEILSYVAPFIVREYRQIYETARAIDMLPSEINLLMANLQSASARGSATPHVDAACEWVKDNLDKVKGWRPSPICASGTGVRTESGGFDPVNLEDANYCEWCPPGRFSNGVLLFTSAGDANLQTNRCERCPRGQKIAIGGSTECESCSAGTFSWQLGQTACELCPVGTYQSERAATWCSQCPTGMVTRQEGSLEDIECMSPAPRLQTAGLAVHQADALSFEGLPVFSGWQFGGQRVSVPGSSV